MDRTPRLKALVLSIALLSACNGDPANPSLQGGEAVTSSSAANAQSSNPRRDLGDAHNRVMRSMRLGLPGKNWSVVDRSTLCSTISRVLSEEFRNVAEATRHRVGAATFNTNPRNQGDGTRAQRFASRPSPLTMCIPEAVEYGLISLRAGTEELPCAGNCGGSGGEDPDQPYVVSAQAYQRIDNVYAAIDGATSSASLENQLSSISVSSLPAVEQDLVLGTAAIALASFQNSELEVETSPAAGCTMEQKKQKGKNVAVADAAGFVGAFTGSLALRLVQTLSWQTTLIVATGQAAGASAVSAIYEYNQPC